MWAKDRDRDNSKDDRSRDLDESVRDRVQKLERSLEWPTPRRTTRKRTIEPCLEELPPPPNI